MSNFVISRTSYTHSFFKFGKDSLDRVSLVARNALEQLSKSLICVYKILITPIVFIKNLATVFVKHVNLALIFDEGSKVHILNLLQKEKILTKELEQLISFLLKKQLNLYPDPRRKLRSDIDEIVAIFKQSHILTSENVENVLKVSNRSELVKACSCLLKVGLLNQELFLKVCKHPIFNHKKSAVSYWKRISKDNLLEYVLNEKVIDDCFNRYTEKLHAYHIRLLDISGAALVLKKSGILSSQNVDLMRDHASLFYFKSLLERLSSTNMLTQAIFDRLIDNPILVSSELWRSFWDRIPEHFLTQSVLDQLLILAQGANPYLAIEGYANQLIGVGNPAGVINPTQSTHTASVHESVSGSAKKLKEKYPALNLEEALTGLTNQITESTLDKKDIALRALNRICGIASGFKDPSSQVSIKELLVFGYLASCPLNVIIDGLAESQREYNLDEAGHDKGGVDRPACASGTFNKIMQALYIGGVDGVNVIYVTKQTATLKLQKVIQDYCEKKSIADITDDNWKDIKANVLEEVEAYRGAFSTNEEWNDFIESGKYVELG